MPIERFEIDTDLWAVVPRMPSVSSEMKAKFIGEFSWEEDASYYDESGLAHEYTATRTVPWDLCKTIFKQMAAHWVATAPSPEPVQQPAQPILTDIDMDRMLYAYKLLPDYVKRTLSIYALAELRKALNLTFIPTPDEAGNGLEGGE